MDSITKGVENFKVVITKVNGTTFTGRIHAIYEQAGIIVLKSVTTEGVKLYGPQLFYSSEVMNLQILEMDVNSKFHSLAQKSLRSKISFASRKLLPSHLGKMNILDTDDLAMSSIFVDGKNDQAFSSGEKNLAEDFDDYYKTDNYILICKMCDTFHEVINHIMEQKIVGLSFEGVDIGRDGTLSLIQVATLTDIFIFDMLRLGDKALQEGIKVLFESEKVLKVIHDCRWISDMIHTKFRLKLVNIFDTQVANIFVYRNENKGDWPQYVEILSRCLENHLNLSQDQLPLLMIRERGRRVEDGSVWLQRPLSEKLLSVAVKNVAHLIALGRVLQNKLLQEFRTGVDIYLHHVKNLGGEIERCRNSRYLLPHAFIEIEKLVNLKLDESRNERHLFQDAEGFHDNIDITDKEIIFSRDSVWHRTNEITACANVSLTSLTIDNERDIKSLTPSGESLNIACIPAGYQEPKISKKKARMQQQAIRRLW